MTTHVAHGPSVLFWGGPEDGAEFESSVELRYKEPPKWFRGYRRVETAFHGDQSVCYVVYRWREVWGEGQ